MRHITGGSVMRASLSGRIALVTGGGTGIGRATALALARGGATVALAARTRKTLEAVAAEVEALGGRAVARVTDLAEEADCRALVSEVVERLGGLDILVNNAADMTRSGPLTEMSVAEWDRAFSVNVRAPFILCQEAVTHLAARDVAHIVNIVSIGARRYYPNIGVYGAAKQALRALTITLSKELRAGTNIRVHAVDPGGVDTDLMRQGLKSGAREDLKSAKLIPASEIAELIRFLVSYEGVGMIDEIAIRRSGADYYCFE